jgi:hypothetical protein
LAGEGEIFCAANSRFQFHYVNGLNVAGISKVVLPGWILNLEILERFFLFFSSNKGWLEEIGASLINEYGLVTKTLGKPLLL